MELVKYVGCVVHIDIGSGFYYKGKVIDADEEFITLIDLKQREVTLSKKCILSIREVV